MAVRDGALRKFFKPFNCVILLFINEYYSISVEKSFFRQNATLFCLHQNTGQFSDWRSGELPA